jgi:hypothetical protein
MQGKTAEAADLDPLTVGERLAHLIEHGLYRQLNIFIGQLSLFAGEYLYEF